MAWRGVVLVGTAAEAGARSSAPITHLHDRGPQTVVDGDLNMLGTAVTHPYFLDQPRLFALLHRLDGRQELGRWIQRVRVGVVPLLWGVVGGVRVVWVVGVTIVGGLYQIFVLHFIKMRVRRR